MVDLVGIWQYIALKLGEIVDNTDGARRRKFPDVKVTL